MGTDTPDRGALRPPAPAVRLLPAAVRAGHEPAARRHPRGAGHVAVVHDRPRGQPARTRPAVVPPDRAAVPDPRQRRAGQAPPHRPTTATGPGFTAARRCRASTRSPAVGDALREALDRVRTRGVSDAIADGKRILVLSDRDSDAEHAPIPSLLAHRPRCTTTSSARRPARRSASSSRPATPARCTTSRCCSATAPARSTRTSRSRRSTTSSPRSCTASAGWTDARRDQELHQGRGQGHAQGDVEDGHLHRRVVHRRADLRGDRPAARSSSTSTSPAPRRASAASAST